MDVGQWPNPMHIQELVIHRKRPQKKHDTRPEMRGIGIGKAHPRVGVEAVGEKFLLLEAAIDVAPGPRTSVVYYGIRCMRLPVEPHYSCACGLLLIGIELEFEDWSRDCGEVLEAEGGRERAQLLEAHDV